MVDVEEWVCAFIVTEKGSYSTLDFLMRMKSGFVEEDLFNFCSYWSKT
ncbi:MAG: hypothetical protein WBA22_13635 [Candidatus Methanofastidiosia archaeon]